ncbi:MAG TPA: hypothetical protein VFG69_20505 [Nannocystaceae bacterium]|nr:hypothetical protein [Nannocystaceae bacterium]
MGSGQQSGSSTSDDAGTATFASTTTTESATEDTVADDSANESSGPHTPVCGDGVVELGEQCDGMPVAGVPCPDTCRFPAKTELWSTFVDVHGLDDDPFGVDVGRDDEIYVAGLTTSGETFSDPLLFRLSDAGAVEWVDATVIAAGSGARALHFDVSTSADAVYVVGGVDPLDDANMQIRTARHDLDGAPVWEAVYAGPIEAATYEGHALETLADGSVLVVGVEMQDGLTPAVVLHYAPDGTLLEDERVWAPPWNARLRQSDVNTLDLALDPSGQDYVVSGTATTPTTEWDGWLQRRSLTHQTIWERLATGPVNGGDLDSYYAVTVDAHGNSIAVGVYKGAGTGQDIWVHKYDVTGALLWTVEYDEAGEDRAHGVVTDDDGNIYVHGNTEAARLSGGGEDIDLWLRKYDAAGTEIWTDIWNGGGVDGAASYDYASRLCLDSHGFLVVTAKSVTANGHYDALVRKIAP